MELGVSSQDGHRAKNEEIKAFRGFAIIFAVFSHLGSLYFWGNPTYGKITQYVQTRTGVDLFFVLSGCVVARSISRDMPKTRNWCSFSIAVASLLADLNYCFLETSLQRYGIGVARRFRERARAAKLELSPSFPFAPNEARSESHGLARVTQA